MNIKKIAAVTAALSILSVSSGVLAADVIVSGENAGAVVAQSEGKVLVPFVSTIGKMGGITFEEENNGITTVSALIENTVFSFNLGEETGKYSSIDMDGTGYLNNSSVEVSFGMKIEKINGLVYIPASSVAEVFKATLNYTADGGVELGMMGSAVSQMARGKQNEVVILNGNPVSFSVYNINDNNYFKLRDLAMALNDTDCEFEVEWVEAKNLINLKSHEKYTAVGGELAESIVMESATAIPTNSKITLDNEVASIKGYNINDNNFFKLRDLGKALNFYVGFDEVNQIISIDTNKGYDPASE